MSLLTSTYGLVSQAKDLNPDGTLARTAEVLNRNVGNIFADAPWVQSNDLWTNKTVRRSSLPSGQKRNINERIGNSVSRKTEINDVIMNIEDFLEVDALFHDNQPSPAVWRRGEVDAFKEGMGQGFISEFIYSDANADPKSMHGVQARLNTIDNRFVYGAGGTGSDLTSILVVTWGKDHAHFIYPKNLAATLGVVHTDQGRSVSETADGKMNVLRDHFAIRGGFVVRDPRSIGRIANIESAGASNTFDEDDLIRLTTNMRINGGSRIYVNDTVKAQMQIRMKDKANVNFTQDGGDGLSGMPLMRFNGIPIMTIDREVLTNTEDAITT